MLVVGQSNLVSSARNMSSDDQHDRLVKTLQMCFSELFKKQEEHSDRLHKTLERLSSKAPGIDKTTTFWNLYKTLANEHDKAFQKKYSTDLDASLIFAGLFSAVDSAFIIQIQPEIRRINTPLLRVVAQSLLYISLRSALLATLLVVLGKQGLIYYSAAA
ncbi:hypothetical protein C8J57DRAFT_1507513 [Mycena rebaudengoi]|nr:hypothetical protein C8J57DRAFT_1507513 [Mycena rebaudengoi]